MQFETRAFVGFLAFVFIFLPVAGFVAERYGSKIARSSLDTRIVRIKGVEVNVFVADTPLLRRKGLSGMESLAEEDGMLFVFNESGAHGIWMRGMLFAIDIIWIDENGRIVDVLHSVSPDTFPSVFYPSGNAKYVLEVRSGFAENLGIMAGVRVEL